MLAGQGDLGEAGDQREKATTGLGSRKTTRRKSDVQGDT